MLVSLPRFYLQSVIIVNSNAMNNKIHYFVFMFVLLLAGCYGDDEVAIHESPVMVVEGWIEEGQHPHVLVSMSIEPTIERQRIEDLSNNILHWAKVTISDGEKEEILLGKYDKDCFPPFVFTTSEIIGKSGATYYLNVDYNDYHATASTTIPTTVPIMNLRQYKKEDSDSLYSVEIEFEDPKDSKNYYQIFTNIGYKIKQPLPAYLGVISDETLGNHVKTNVYPSHTIQDYEEQKLYFHQDDSVCIRLTSIDKESYSYWKGHSEALAFGRNFIMPYTRNLSTNMQGAYGYWCGYGSDIRWIIVGK